eukprot:TRINITY_DN29705_c0_g1_i1.p1 TRINITY_DN29705_c0_g1~~TRINITY_DN29705_c0_g1_i1.p1  ORF type:complete len:441 (+),score=81.81 TRINITY_DN29705_c0_g1_i1:443-1765(+)
MDTWTDIILGDEHNLGGSLDSTDCYCGDECCQHVLRSRLQHGVASRSGWSVVDDSRTALWTDNPHPNPVTDQESWAWRIPRAVATTDWYLFLQGSDYRAAVKDFVTLAGRTPLKPWRSHGVWWSREYPYSDTAVQQLIKNFSVYQLPLNMLVLDYNWHPGPPSPGVPLVPPIEGCNQPTIAEGQCVAGFGGYQWDLALFPDPVAFQRWVHNRSGADLQLVLNIHDQCGIDSCQFNYAAAAHAAGIDPSSRAPVPCGFLQKSYAESLTAGMLEADPHHALTDFWWEDYGLGGPGIGKYQVLCTANDSSKSSFGHCLHCYQDDVDAKPQLWSAYVHGSRREMKNLRSLTLGIYGGLGHHRYPGVGSGDVYASWGTLQFEIFLSVTAANVVTEWNHDLGGFMETADSRIGRFDPLLNATTWLHPPERYPVSYTHLTLPTKRIV